MATARGLGVTDSSGSALEIGTRSLVVWMLLMAWGCEVETSWQREHERGQNALWVGRPELARGYFAAATQSNPSSAESWFGLARAHRRGLEGSVELAEQAARRTLAMAPTSSQLERDAREFLGELLRFRGRHQEAADVLSQLDESPLQSLLAVDLAQMEGLEQAVAAAESACVRWPDEPTLLRACAEIFVQAGQADRALELSNRAVRLEPFSPSLHYVRGRSLIAAGADGKAALALSEELGRLEMAPLSHDEDQVERWLDRVDRVQAVVGESPALLAWRVEALLLARRSGLSQNQPLMLSQALSGAAQRFDGLRFLHRSELETWLRVVDALGTFPSELESLLMAVDRSELSAQTLQAFLLRGVVFFGRLGDRQRAAQWAQGLATSGRSHAQVQLALAETDLAADHGGVLQLLERAFELAPFLPQTALSLCDQLLVTGEASECQSVLEVAVEHGLAEDVRDDYLSRAGILAVGES